MPRFAGPATMMRLPSAESAKGLDACFVGVPFDIGTSNRPGARFGPRQMRAESSLLRPYNMATRAAPFDSLRVADIGDVAINTFNLEASVQIIERAYDEILGHDCIPLTLGGDHTIALPILRALARKNAAGLRTEGARPPTRSSVPSPPTASTAASISRASTNLDRKRSSAESRPPRRRLLSSIRPASSLQSVNPPCSTPTRTACASGSRRTPTAVA